jgi:hypothetical protein
MPRKPKTRHGATQPEGERKTGQVLLRLSPVVEGILRDQSDRQDIPMSSLVSYLVLESWGEQYDEGPDALNELRKQRFAGGDDS